MDKCTRMTVWEGQLDPQGAEYAKSNSRQGRKTRGSGRRMTYWAQRVANICRQRPQQLLAGATEAGARRAAAAQNRATGGGGKPPRQKSTPSCEGACSHPTPPGCGREGTAGERWPPTLHYSLRDRLHDGPRDVCLQRGPWRAEWRRAFPAGGRRGLVASRRPRERIVEQHDAATSGQRPAASGSRGGRRAAAGCRLQAVAR